MNLRSLGYRTDLIFPAFDGEIVDRDEYMMIKSPRNPTFHWGNFLLFPSPPQMGDHVKWRAIFEAELGAPPEVNHIALGWDSPEGDEGEIQPFLAAGFRLVRLVVLTCNQLQPPATPSAIAVVRTLTSEHDWEQAIDNQMACRESEFGERGYRTFRQRQMDRYWKMFKAGRGCWYGAFVGERLVADLGIFHAGELGRYQTVQTHPEFRRQGIGASLVYEAGRQAMLNDDLRLLVIVAEQYSNAARLYQSLGFEPTEKQVGVEWWLGKDLREGDQTD